jgi:hypothetical protein
MSASRPEKTGMTTADIAARIRRLDKLARGLALELHNVGKADDPMFYTERQQYLAAMRRVLKRPSKKGSDPLPLHRFCCGKRAKLVPGARSLTPF